MTDKVDDIQGPLEPIDAELVEKVGNYYGSKKRWIDLIIDKYIPEGTRTLFDPMCGMSWILWKAACKGIDVTGNEINPLSFAYSHGLFNGTPIDIDEFLKTKPIKGRMSTSEQWRETPSDIANMIDALAVKANAMKGGAGIWARALVANALAYSTGSYAHDWNHAREGVQDWAGFQGVIRRAHNKLVQMQDDIKGNGSISNQDARDIEWKNYDVVILDPPYYGTGMTLYSEQYKKRNSILMQKNEDVRYKDLTEDEFFNDILPRAVQYSKTVLLFMNDKHKTEKILGEMELQFKQVKLPSGEYKGRTRSTNLNSAIRLYVIDGNLKAINKSNIRSWLIGTGGGIPTNQPDAQSIEAARLGVNYPHNLEPALLIDDKARVLIDCGPNVGHDLSVINPDAIIITGKAGDKIDGLKYLKNDDGKLKVFAPKDAAVDIAKLIPKSYIMTYEPGDQLIIMNQSFDTYPNGAIKYNDIVYTPQIDEPLAWLTDVLDDGCVWIVDAAGVGNKPAQTITINRPSLDDILTLAQNAGVGRVILTNIGRHKMTQSDFRSMIADISRIYNIPVTIGEDSMDLREVRLWQEETLFVKDGYDPVKVTNAQLADDFRLVAAKWSTMLDGGATEFENETELINFAADIVKEILQRDKITFHYDDMKRSSQKLISAVLEKLIESIIALPSANLIAEKIKTAALQSERNDKMKSFNILMGPGGHLFGFIRFDEAQKIDPDTADKMQGKHGITPAERAEIFGADIDELFLYPVRDFIPYTSGPRLATKKDGGKKSASKPYTREYYDNMKVDAEFVQELGAILTYHVKGNNILELGCGNGRALQVLLESGIDICGIESSKDAIELADEYGLSALIDNGDAENLSEYKDGSVDFVFSMHLLEHLSNPVAALKESIRIARKKSVHLVPLGKRLDATHKHIFMSLDDVRTLAADISGMKTVLRGPNDTALLIIDRTLEQPGPVIESMADTIMIPGYICLVGGQVKHDGAEDVDIVIRQEERDEALELKIRNQIPEQYHDKLHFIYNPKGPHDDNIPVYDLLLSRCMPERRNIAKRMLEPPTVFTPLKTSGGYSLQEFFDIEDFYEAWAKPYLDENISLDVEQKYNGWRTVGQVDKDGKVLIYFEDSKRNRADQFPDLRDELLAIGKPVILDLELGAINTEGDVMARKDLAFWGGKKKVPMQFETPGGEKGSLIAHVFDILYYDGQDLHDKPWTDRRAKLEKLFGSYDFKIMQPSKTKIVETKGQLINAIKDVSEKDGSEGAVVKVTNSLYPLTGQSPAWSKIKNVVEIKVKVLGRDKVKGSERTYNYAVGYETDGEILPLAKTFNTNLDAPNDSIMTISVEEIIPKWNNKKERWEVSVVVPRARDIELGRKEPENALDIIKRGSKANILQLDARTRDRLKKDRIIKEYKEGGLSFKEGDQGTGVLQTHEMGLSESQVKNTGPFGWEPVEPTPAELDALKRAVNADWGQAVKQSRDGDSKRLERLIKDVKDVDLDADQRRALDRIDPVGIHSDFRLRPDEAAYWEGGEGFTPGNQFKANLFRTIAKEKDAGKILGNFKVGREQDGGEPVTIDGQEIIRGPIGWLKMGQNNPVVFNPGEIGATADTYGRMMIRDRFDWIAGIQDKHFKEFWFEGNTLKGRWIFQYVPVSRVPGTRRAWMISRPNDQVMKSELARKLIKS